MDSEVHLTDAERERWDRALREITEVADVLGETGTLSITAGQMDFLHPRCRLIRALLHTPKGTWTAWFLGWDEPIFAMVFGQQKAFFDRVRAEHGASALRLGPDTVGSYLRTVLPTQLPGALVVEEPGELVTYEPGHGNRWADEVRRGVFFTPLVDLEKTRVAQALEQHPFRVVESNPDAVTCEACVLLDGSLSLRWFTVSLLNKPGGFGEPGKLAGQIDPGKTVKTLVEGLPRNHGLDGWGLPRDAWFQPIADVQGWEPVPLELQGPRLQDLSRLLLPLMGPPVDFHRIFLPFYGLEWLRITAPIQGHTDTVFVLWRPGVAVGLDGTSSPIHSTNDARVKERGGGPLLDNVADAATYLRFFCASIWADASAFPLLESPQDPILAGVNWEKADIEGSPVTSLEDLKSRFQPLTVESMMIADKPGFHARGCLAHEDGVFQAGFGITQEGQVEMIEDDELPLAEVEGMSLPGLPFGEFSSLASEGLVPVEARDSEGEVWEDLLVIGQVNRENFRGREFRRCRFRGLVDLRGFSGDQGLRIVDCVFEGGLVLEKAKIAGAVELINSVVLLGQQAAGTFSLDDLTADSLSVDQLQVQGTLSIARATLRSLSLMELTTLGGVELGYGSIHQSIWIYEAFIAGSLELYGTVVEQNFLALRGRVLIEGDLNASFLRVGTGMFLGYDDHPFLIQGNLELGGATISKVLRIHNGEVRGDIQARSLTSGAVRLLGGRLASSPQPEPSEEEGTPGGGLPLRVGGWMDFSSSKIEDDVWFLDVETPAKSAEVVRPALSMRAVSVGSDVRLFAEARWLADRDWYLGAGVGMGSVLAEGVDLTQARIGGEIDLSGLQCPAGAIDLDDAEVAHDLVIRAGTGRAQAQWLSLDSFVCQGTTDATGLDLVPPGPDSPHRSGVSGRFSQFVRGLTLASRGPHFPVQVTLIPGLLDLTGSQIGELVVSNDSFPPQPLPDRNRGPATGPQEVGLVLNQAVVNKLTCVMDEKNYPKPIDLRYAEIKWWDFDKRSSSQSGTARDFLELLKNDPHPQQHTFRSIERNLIDQGKEEDADQIHKAMRAWLRRQPRRAAPSGWRRFPWAVVHGLRTAGLGLWDFVTVSTTSPHRLLLLVFAWFCFSAAFFSDPANIAPSTEGLLTHPQDYHLDEPPSADQWKGLAPLWMALRYHIPVATFFAQEDWQPSSRDAWVTVPLVNCPLTAEDYANLVLAIHWILWPIILIIGSRKLFRHLEK